MREKTFTHFAVCEPPTEVFCTKFWACHTHLYDWFSIPRKFSLRNAHFVLIYESFPLYGIIFTALPLRDRDMYMYVWYSTINLPFLFFTLSVSPLPLSLPLSPPSSSFSPSSSRNADSQPQWRASTTSQASSSR